MIATSYRIFGAALLPGLAGCGQAAESVKDSLSQEYRAEYIKECTSSSTALGMDKAETQAFCTCSVDKIQQDYGLKEQLNLSDEQMDKVLDYCMDQADPEVG